MNLHQFVHFQVHCIHFTFVYVPGYAGYWCQCCSVHCSSASAWRQHCNSLKHQQRQDGAVDGGNPWCQSTSRWLKQFPRRQGGTLDVSSKFFDLDAVQQVLFLGSRLCHTPRQSSHTDFSISGDWKVQSLLGTAQVGARNSSTQKFTDLQQRNRKRRPSTRVLMLG